jgi:hypothetical protein
LRFKSCLCFKSYLFKSCCRSTNVLQHIFATPMVSQIVSPLIFCKQLGIRTGKTPRMGSRQGPKGLRQQQITRGGDGLRCMASLVLLSVSFA